MKRGKILIVDDNEDILFTLKMLLRPIAESITTLNDPRELLPIISRTRFDVILLDMNFRQALAKRETDSYRLLRTATQFQPDGSRNPETTEGDFEKTNRSFDSSP